MGTEEQRTSEIAVSLSEKALSALVAMRDSSPNDAMTGKAMARMLWPDALKDCGSSVRRGALYRAAGGFCSKLAKRGLVQLHIDDFHKGWYLTELGRAVIARAGRSD